MVRHIVSWNFKPEISAEERTRIQQEMSEAFPRLVGVVPGLLCVETGMPPLGSSNADMSLYCEMEKKEDLFVYRDHPEHEKLASIIRANCQERRCVDILSSDDHKE